MTGLAEIDAIRDEVNYWTNYAIDKRKDKNNSNVLSSTLKVDNATTMVPPIGNSPTLTKNITNTKPVVINDTSNNVKKSRVIESNRRLQSLADMKRSNPSTTSDFNLSPQIIYNNYVNDLHKQQTNRASGKSKRSSI